MRGQVSTFDNKLLPAVLEKLQKSFIPNLLPSVPVANSAFYLSVNGFTAWAKMR